MRLPLSEIRVDETIQPRVELDQETVSDYADAVRRGDEFPSIVAFKDTEGVNWLADGFHRFRAHEKAQAEYISVDVREGEYRDARLYAIRANAKNARRYTNADKRKIAFVLLNDPEVRQRPNAEIAEDISGGAFTAAFFGNVRSEWESQNGLGNPIRKCRDGRQIDTTNLVGPKKAGALLDAINFVMPAVSKRDVVRALAHLHIRDGRVLAYDGAHAANSPIAPEVPTCSPHASTFAKAIREATGTIQVEVLRSGDIKVSDAGGMTTCVLAMDEAHPNIGPEGTLYEAIPDLLKTFETLEPFISRDASRPWSRGILLTGAHAYATDNVIAIEMPQLFPVKMNLPVEAVRFILGTKQSPTNFQVCEDSITFHFQGDRWLRSQLLKTEEWPDVAAALPSTDRCIPVPEDFFDALEKIRPAETVHFHAGYVSSSSDPESGAKQRLPGASEAWGRHDRKRLLKLKDRATSFDLGMHPAPCPFRGRDGLRGVVLGMTRQLGPDSRLLKPTITHPVAGVPPWENLDLGQFAQRHDLEVLEIGGEQVALVREDDLAKFR